MLTIGEFSKLSGTTVKTLRYYDEINILKPVKVDEKSGYRYYEASQLENMILIQKFKAYEFSLDEIKEVLTNRDNNEILAKLIKEKSKLLKIKSSEINYVLQIMKEDLNTLAKGENIMDYLDNIEVKVVDVPEMNILSVRDMMSIKDYDIYVKKLFGRVETEKLTLTGPPLTLYYDSEFNADRNDTEIAIQILEKVEGTRTTPKTKCVMARLEGPYTELPSIYAKLVNFIEENNYEIAGAPFDMYMTNPFEVAPEDNITEVYFPIRIE